MKFFWNSGKHKRCSVPSCLFLLLLLLHGNTVLEPWCWTLLNTDHQSCLPLRSRTRQVVRYSKEQSTGTKQVALVIFQALSLADEHSQPLRMVTDGPGPWTGLCAWTTALTRWPLGLLEPCADATVVFPQEVPFKVRSSECTKMQKISPVLSRSLNGTFLA